jgi:hypothetical protein
MPKSDQVQKKILEVDGEELEGLINIDEYVIEDDVVDIPSFDKTVPVRNGVKKIPPIPTVFKVKRDSKTYQILEDWYYKKETHEVTLRKTDGAGKEMKRELWPNTEVSKFHDPAYDASAPVTAQILVTFLPEDIIPIKAEG